MDLSLLHILLGAAVLLPLLSFAVIVLSGPLLGKGGEIAGYMATGAIVVAFLLSMISFVIWVGSHPPQTVHHGTHAGSHNDSGADDEGSHASDAALHDVHSDEIPSDEEAHNQNSHDDPEHASDHGPVEALAGDWYILGEFGQLRLTIGYYIDALTICMFCMVTLIASCIHFYAMGYMHEELHDVTDHEVALSDGSYLHRPGRYHRFFQYMSLFCFSMLGLVIAGNVAMTFVFWELVGICSYFLIGFYVERHSASTAANKAFIVNRIGDFGMIIGLMALWGSLGTLAYGDVAGHEGLFSIVRPGDSHELVTPIGMVRAALPEQVGTVVRSMPTGSSHEEIEAAIDAEAVEWRGQESRPGYWLLIIAGVGIFCGCVGKSAQFPLHVWLPDAMEGPTPVSALVHSATMVAAGVFLVARFYPVFTPEVLFVIAVTGTVTLFMAATIAITATDIKRVLAYSTVSQLGYMMLALGLGGWLAGVMHLITHAFFKSLLFLCSGSVIHAVHTNEMPQMGGLRKKMPWTAYTMLIGCLAISGAGIPFLIGFSGYYSKDAILEQALSFRNANPLWGTIFFFAAAGGAAITAFYMFRLWYMTFAGSPRDQHRYDHAHESPPVMFVPLVILAIFAVAVAWKPTGDPGLGGFFGNEALLGSLLGVVILAVIWASYGRSVDRQTASETPGHIDEHGGTAASPLKIALGLSVLVLLVAAIWSLPPTRHVVLVNLLEQARPAGTLPTETAALMEATWPNEHLSHEPGIKIPATIIAFSTALSGFLLATVFYGWRVLDPNDVRNQFRSLYRFLWNKWWFDELYDRVFVRPTHQVSRWAASFDRGCIDWVVDGSARLTRAFSVFWDRVADRTIVDGSINKLAEWTYATGLSLRIPQTGRLRQYVMFIVAGTIAGFILVTFVWSVYAR